MKNHPKMIKINGVKMKQKFVNHNERQCILNVAPAEGNKPLTEFKDEFSEELAYPGIFPGQHKAWSQRSLSQSFLL